MAAELLLQEKVPLSITVKDSPAPSSVRSKQPASSRKLNFRMVSSDARKDTKAASGDNSHREAGFQASLAPPASSGSGRSLRPAKLRKRGADNRNG